MPGPGPGDGVYSKRFEVLNIIFFRFFFLISMHPLTAYSPGPGLIAFSTAIGCVEGGTIGTAPLLSHDILISYTPTGGAGDVVTSTNRSPVDRNTDVPSSFLLCFDLFIRRLGILDADTCLSVGNIVLLSCVIPTAFEVFCG